MLASDAHGVPGTSIDFTRDLGFANRGLPGVQLVVKAAAKHKIRFEYIPIRYTASGTPARELVFDGAQLSRRRRRSPPRSTGRRGASATSTTSSSGRASSPGSFVEGRQTDITVRLAGASADHSVRTEIPIPAAGGIVRVQAGTSGCRSPARSISSRCRTTRQKNYGGRYADVDLYATVALDRRLAARGGFRSLAIRHLGETDSGR